MAEAEAGTGPEVALLFIGVSLGLGAACRQLLRNTRVPYTVALLLVGIALGAIDYKASNHLGKLGKSISMWNNIDPNLIFYVFLPALLFESSFSLEFHQIKRCLFQMFLLAGPGVCISTILLGLVDKFVLPYNWNWATSLLLGGLLSATDPVAVVALLRDLGASKKLSTIIDGEALMNDGSAIVVFQLFLKITRGQTMSAGDIIAFLFRVSLGAIALGLAFGLAGVVWLRRVFNDYVIETTLTFTVSYMGFFVANGVTDTSGVLTVMTLGIVFGVFAKTALTGESEHSMHHFWEMVAFIANTLIFILSGVVIAESILRSGSLIQGRDWAYLVVLYVFVQLSRVVVVGVLYPGLALSGYGIDWREATVLVWSGLRGAVALTLALIINHEDDREHISEITAARILFLTGGVVFLTLIINGSTTQFLLSILKMNKTSETKKRILEYTRHEMYSHALKTFQEVGEDEELGPADWPTVRRYVHCLNRPPHPSDGDVDVPRHYIHTVEELRLQQIQDVRLRFLNGIQASYWTMLEEGRITQTAAMLLMQSVAESIDVASKHQRLDVWCGVRPHVRLPVYLKLLRSGAPWLPERVFSWLTVGRVELAASMAATFLRAQRHARQQLRKFMGHNELADIVLKESREQDGEAKKFLEDVRLSFPEVLRIIKTKQVTGAILLELMEYVSGLERAGLLDTKETNHLQDAVQADLKSLMHKPPLVAMPKPAELLAMHPLVGPLPPEIRKLLEGSAKPATKLSGNILIREGNPADGIWLISTGIVQWSMASKTAQEGSEPTTVHGGSVGLYEVLTSQPYICTVVADAVMNCFFIERAKVLAAFQSSPEVAEFMWEEAALLVAKVVVEEEAAALSLPDLRALLGHSARMLQHRRGAAFALQPGEAAVLLEGAVLRGEAGPPLAAPCALRFVETARSDPISARSKPIGSQYTCTAACRLLLLQLSRTQQHAASEEAVLADTPHGSSGRFTMGDRKGSHDHDGLLRWNQEEAENEEAMAARALGSGTLPATDMMLAPGRAGSSYTIIRHNSGEARRPGSMPHLVGGEARTRVEASAVRNGHAGEGEHLIESASDSEGDEHIVSVDSPSRLFSTAS